MSADYGESNDLAERLRKLERENFRMKRIGLAIATVLCLAVVFFHNGVRSEVTAQHFILRDSSGRMRAELGLVSEEPVLALYATSGEPRAQLMGGGENAGLNLYLPVTASKPSTAAVNFFREDTLLSSLSAGPGAAALDLRSADGTEAAKLSIQAGGAALALRGGGEHAPQAAITADPYDSCTTVSDAAQAASGSLCVKSGGLPALRVADQNGDRAILGVSDRVDRRTQKPAQTSAASLVLEHGEGNVLWSTPH
jgi:hypothetical protein